MRGRLLHQQTCARGHKWGAWSSYHQAPSTPLSLNLPYAHSFLTPLHPSYRLGSRPVAVALHKLEVHGGADMASALAFQTQSLRKRMADLQAQEKAGEERREALIKEHENAHSGGGGRGRAAGGIGIGSGAAGLLLEGRRTAEAVPDALASALGSVATFLAGGRQRRTKKPGPWAEAAAGAAAAAEAATAAASAAMNEAAKHMPTPQSAAFAASRDPSTVARTAEGAPPLPRVFSPVWGKEPVTSALPSAEGGADGSSEGRGLASGAQVEPSSGSSRLVFASPLPGAMPEADQALQGERSAAARLPDAAFLGKASTMAAKSAEHAASGLFASPSKAPQRPPDEVERLANMAKSVLEHLQDKIATAAAQASATTGLHD